MHWEISRYEHPFTCWKIESLIKEKYFLPKIWKHNNDNDSTNVFIPILFNVIKEQTVTRHEIATSRPSYLTKMTHPCPGKENKFHIGVSSIKPNPLLQVILTGHIIPRPSSPWTFYILIRKFAYFIIRFWYSLSK